MVRGLLRSPPSAEVDFRPFRILEVELAQPLQGVSSTDPCSGERYDRALVLVRLHSEPIGMLEIDLVGDGADEDRIAERVWSELSAEVNDHLAADGLSQIATLTRAGIASDDPACELARRKILADPPRVTVVIPTRDRPESLRAALRTLQQLDYPNYEVTIVDSAPKTNSTRDLVLGEFPEVRYLREELPGSFRARNTGLASVTTDYVAFTDDDALIDRHWLTALVAAFQARPRITCVTGMTMPAELETWSQLWFEQYGGFHKGFVQRHYSRDQMKIHRAENPLFPYTAGKFGSGVNMAFRTDALRQLGGFDTVLSNGSTARGGGDIDAYYRAIMHGNGLVYQPSAIVYHFHRRDYASLHRQIYNYGVGLTAFLTKCVLREPGRIPDLLLRIPYGLYFAVSPRSPKNRSKAENFPSELSRRELRGMLAGPIAFIRGQRRIQDTAF